jgi:hypothetical protein
VLRDLLIRVAIGHKVRAHWTDQILDEVFENLIENRPDLDRVKLARTRVLMGKALPDAKVTGYESLVPALELPDPDDRHVLAAAIRAGAQMIVTSNLKDFPPECLSPFAIEAKGPDDGPRPPRWPNSGCCSKPRRCTPAGRPGTTSSRWCGCG